jgi:Holliday junction resolvase
MAEFAPAESVLRDTIYRVKRGLCGYVSYLAACEMNEAFSEYVLYEPILRILKERGFAVRCEYVCPGITQPSVGDKKKLDFVARKKLDAFALEVKWAKRSNISFDTDVEKLRAFASSEHSSRAYLCVFGRLSIVRKLSKIPVDFREWGTEVVADFRKTKYCCRVFVLR